MRLIDADELREYWLYNGLNEKIYDTNDVLESIDEQSTIDPESLWPTAHWISVKDRPPEDHVAVFVFDSVCRNIYKAWMSHDLGEWFSEEYLPDFLNITHWMPLPKPPKETHND